MINLWLDTKHRCGIPPPSIRIHTQTHTHIINNIYRWCYISNCIFHTNFNHLFTTMIGVTAGSLLCKLIDHRNLQFFIHWGNSLVGFGDFFFVQNHFLLAHSVAVSLHDLFALVLCCLLQLWTLRFANRCGIRNE